MSGFRVLGTLAGATVAATLLACSSASTNPAPTIAPTSQPLSLAWAAGSQSSTSTNVNVSGVAVLAVTASGTAPFQATIYGNCATLGSATSSSVLNLTLSYNNICVLAVQDAGGNVRSLRISALNSPPRTFLTATETGVQNVADPIALTVGQTLELSADEPLVSQSFNTPYQIVTQGACVSIASKNTPAMASASASLVAANVGQCIVVVSDAAGTATSLNISVSKGSS